MKHLYTYITLIFLVILLANCAKMGSLTGGPVDKDPPKVLSCDPENYSKNFDSKKVEITFDEFLILEDINTELVISPPLKEKPLVLLKNKSIVIDLNNELLDSTTYTLNFGAAIKDNNEKNPLPNYEYVFSTGDFLDSLSVGGTLLNAFDKKPVEDPVAVMLYKDLSDSVVFRDIPIYVGKTDKNGEFRINNLRKGKYKLFALADVNNNLLFDLPNEAIAFTDTILNVDPVFFKEIYEKLAAQDSMNVDSSFMAQEAGKDTLQIQDSQIDTAAIKRDTIIDRLATVPTQLRIDLALFTEENTSQYLTNNSRGTRNRLEFSFNRPVSDSFQIRYLIPDREDWFISETSLDRDSFEYWIIDEKVREMDSILLELNYVVLDTSDTRTWRKDSIFFIYRESSKASKRKDTKKASTSKLTLSGFRNNLVLDINAKVKITASSPVQSVDTSKIEFFKLIDTLQYREPFQFTKDSIKSRVIHFIKEWEPQEKYKITYYPGAVNDVFGGTNDTLNFTFSIQKEDFYGALTVNMDSIQSPMIIQILDTKEKLIREHCMNESGSYKFEYLKAGTYKIKFITDINGNGKWDTGKYILHRQPEKVEYYSKEIEILSNWEKVVNYGD